MQRIGLIGGLSWESTATYYALLNRMTAARLGPWHQPAVLIESLDFRAIVDLQQRDDWAATGAILAEAARHLERAGATVLGIAANTMHRNIDEVRDAVDVPVVDIRDALISHVKGLGASSITLLGTKYLLDGGFYADYLETAGLRVIRPEPDEVDALQAMIYDELTQGVVSDATRARFIEIADHGVARGGDVVALCCTEFGLLINDHNAPWPFVDSTVAHAASLLNQ